MSRFATHDRWHSLAGRHPVSLLPACFTENIIEGARRQRSRSGLLVAGLLLMLIGSSLLGCTGPREYFRNGWKVGPNYRRPPAPVAQKWIDEDDKRVRSTTEDISYWWTTFNDPVLNDLVVTAYRQNLTVRQAAFRVLQARANLGFAFGTLFPQSQSFNGDFTQTQISRASANRGFLPQGSYPNWEFGFSMAWEIDFWGRFRRAIEAADANLNASVEDYDDVLVTLVGDVASTYTQLRTVEQQLVYVAANVQLQRETLEIAKARFAGGQATDLDVEQATSILAQTDSQTPQLEIQRRQFQNALCVLMGMPVIDLEARLGKGAIPSAPPEVAVGIPADLLRRRPDVRRQERIAAAQSAIIGVLESDFYPSLTINGSIGYGAQNFSDLFGSSALQGTVGPSFNWRIFHYGRIINRVRGQEAQFQEMVAKYQQTVLLANQEAENGLVQFLRAQQQTRALAISVGAAERAVGVATVQYKGGLVDFNRLSLIEQNLVNQQNLFAQARSSIALGLIQVYRALGGGWQIRLNQPMNVVRPAEGGLDIKPAENVTTPQGPDQPVLPKVDDLKPNDGKNTVKPAERGAP